MDPTLHQLTTWSAIAAAALVSATWQGLLLATCTALCLRLLPDLSAAARSLLWMGVFLTVVLLHFLPSALFHPGVSHVQAAVLVSPTWALAIAAAWAIFSFYRAAQLAYHAVRLRRIAQQAIPATCDAACTQLLHTGHRPVQLCLSSDVDRPSVIGFLSPCILLPPALLTALSASELEQVILHEMEHLRRNDAWTNLLQKLVLVLLPLNPALLWIEHRLCTERELACDDGVLRQTHARKAYATCLTHLAEHSILRRSASLALGAWERQSELSRRVYRILRQPHPTPNTLRLRWLTGAFSILMLVAAGALARSPQLVRFLPEAQQAELTSVTPAAFPGTAANTPAAHLVLANAVMPRPQAIMTKRRSFPSPAHHKPRPALLIRTSRPLSAPALRQVSIQNMPAPPTLSWVMLTSWQQPQASLRLAVETNLSPSYAAVPIANGWLIIQL